MIDTAINFKFRNYATRVAFALNLTRNQIAVLRAIRDILRLDVKEANATAATHTLYERARHDLNIMPDIFVTGSKKLQEMGLVEWRDPDEMKPKWSKHTYILTEAGEATIRLLELTGLIPEVETKPKKRSA